MKNAGKVYDCIRKRSVCHDKQITSVFSGDPFTEEVMKDIEKDKQLKDMFYSWREERRKEFRLADENSLLIMDMVVQLEEFKHFPDTYIHRFEQESDNGLEMNLLQKYLFVPLDIFQKIQHNKNGEIKIANRLEAWLAFLCMDRPEEIIAIIEKYPDFKDLYSQIYDMCRNIEEVMAMFSKELLEMDRNTVQLMIDDMQKELDETKDELVGTEGKLDEARNEVELLRRKLAELEGNR